MDLHQLTRELHVKNNTKIVMYVADGLGGLPQQPGGLTELETANTPNLDALAKRGVCGGSIPVLPGISPGSGPGHLGLFGYDPLKYLIGRGALEATGIGFKLAGGRRRHPRQLLHARRQPATSPTAAPAASPPKKAPRSPIKLREVTIPGVEVFVEPVKEHRFVIVLRGPGLHGHVARHRPASAPASRRSIPSPPTPTARRRPRSPANSSRQARKLLAGQPKANGLTLRGFSGKPKLPSYEEVYGLRAAAIAVYPMYKGLAQLVGMDIVGKPQTLDEQMTLLEQNWSKYDFFFIHFKYTDSTGEDGNFAAKVKRTEEFDAAVPRITALKPDVFIVTGDHSTPSMLDSHSWHPVPTLLVGQELPHRRLPDNSAKANASAAASASSKPSTS